jgi:hypothetical protein
MGTRSTTHVYEIDIPLGASHTNVALKKHKPIKVLTLYRQFDGYPAGHGQDLVDFMKGMTIVNGFNPNEDKAGTHANGAGCFAAQLVKHLKDGIGGLYITCAKAERQQYNYHLYVQGDPQPIIVRVEDGRGKEMFNGTRDQFVAWVKAETEKE